MPRRVVSGLDVTGMENFAAWIHGDGTAARYGGTPVGLPAGAGYAVGNRLVDAYLEATGRTAPEASLADSRDVIETAPRASPAVPHPASGRGPVRG
ncbi:hypothetical protein GCM10027445_29840 [Amycolatopsis endophytica]|uniref:Uncharacterized protein YjaZ n=1 Tax=Amycolatopsis endophytica TaxID=860233 RepID=A0A853B9V1_9PSEU|nr:DUF2268 domain-containing putative Zn-dependent protease [Amycolatopsis endophytica]NYI91919.1 uncharacterized protein YjaZ [Amycolatopsis endophytica]